MPDPLSTIFISSSPIGSDARESAGVSICQSLLHVEAYRWIPCGGPLFVRKGERKLPNAQEKMTVRAATAFSAALPDDHRSP